MNWQRFALLSGSCGVTMVCEWKTDSWLEHRSLMRLTGFAGLTNCVRWPPYAFSVCSEQFFVSC
jgi:hypothetical protein